MSLRAEACYESIDCIGQQHDAPVLIVVVTEVLPALGISEVLLAHCVDTPVAKKDGGLLQQVPSGRRLTLGFAHDWIGERVGPFPGRRCRLAATCFVHYAMRARRWLDAKNRPSALARRDIFRRDRLALARDGAHRQHLGMASITNDSEYAPWVAALRELGDQVRRIRDNLAVIREIDSARQSLSSLPAPSEEAIEAWEELSAADGDGPIQNRPADVTGASYDLPIDGDAGDEMDLEDDDRIALALALLSRVLDRLNAMIGDLTTAELRALDCHPDDATVLTLLVGPIMRDPAADLP